MFPRRSRSRRRWPRSSRCISAQIISGNARRCRCARLSRHRGNAGNARRRKGLRRGDARHDREIPVHLGLDRHAEGRHQHPAHAELEPAGQGADLAVSRDSRRDLVILDWLPWSHTFGANHNFNLVLRNGGTLYIDGGKPAPGLFATSLANLRERHADGLFQRAARLRHADRGAARRRGAAPPLLQRGEIRLLRRRRAAAESLGRARGAFRQDRRPRDADGLGLGLDRDRRRWRPTAISWPSAPAISACRCRAPS